MSTSLEIGDIVSYKNWQYPVTGFYNKLCDSSSDGYVLVYPCHAKDASHVKLSFADMAPVRSVRKQKNPMFGFDNKERAIFSHNKAVEEFENLHTEDDPAISLCFKIKEK